MKHLQQIEESKQVSPFFSFYILVGMQIAVGILGFQRILTQHAGQDAWVAVLISGLSIHILLWICYHILNKGRGDLVAIQRDLFGPFIGTIVNSYFILYYSLFVLVVLRTYIEVIQVWMFEDVYLWVFAALFLILIYSFVSGGLRVVVGISVLSFFIGLPLFFSHFFMLQHAHVYNLLPVMEHSFQEIMLASKAMTLNYLGFGVIFMIYPFLKKAPTSHKWAQAGVAFTVFTYLFTLLTSLVYYNQNQLANTIWPTLTSWKIVDLAVVERFEYIGLSIWFFIVLSNLAIGLWAASRTAKRTFPVSQRTALRIITLIIFGCSLLFVERDSIDRLNDIASAIGFYTIYAYIPFLFIIQAILYKVRKKR
ncbi:GerAB/ArcD/ProY family transporter [Bacillus sp. JCM 19041]|uniref:GerAB/ArcD/ProY family transporter n=1 Tax=Bacillus sp. JCM 19041 TaxID=1460637 RepID=UPI0006D0DA69